MKKKKQKKYYYRGFSPDRKMNREEFVKWYNDPKIKENISNAKKENEYIVQRKP